MASWARALGVLGGVCVAGAIIAAACLPDLPNTCGDGHIDTDNFETCDPGTTPDPGCSPFCQIQCAAPDGGGYFFDQVASNHCYFTYPTVQTFDNAARACSPRAHPVTFVDPGEVLAVVRGLGGSWLPDAGQFWVGLELTANSNVDYFALASNEPGWNVPDACAGCFIDGVTNSIPHVDGGGDAECVVAELSDDNLGASMATQGRGSLAQVVCEREPLGSRSVPCFDGSFCFQILATLGQAFKNYLYHPNATSAVAAGDYCRRLVDGGVSSLVVFDSRAEREQVIYELSQLRNTPGAGGPPLQFWIGLHSTGASSEASGGWVWDDGKPASATSSAPSHPSVWGDGQPGDASGTAYINLESGYDTGLAKAGMRSTTMVQSLPFVCQY